MIDNSSFLRNQKQLLIDNDEKNVNFRIFEKEYDTDIILNENISNINRSHVFKKYIGFNKYYIFFILRILNPVTKIQIIEATPSNIHNIFYSKNEKYNNCIYIYYHPVTNKVTNIRYITKN